MQILRSLSSYFINKYITNLPFSVTCGLEAMDHQVEYSLIRIFWLIKQILWSLGVLLQEKNSHNLVPLTKLELFLRDRDSASYQESTVDLFQRISSLFNS